MRKSVLDVYVDVITEEQALHSLLVAPGEQVVFVGAGLSKEAGVPLAVEICEDIRRELARSRKDGISDSWARENLNWDDPTRRYGTCLEKYGPAEDRVNYFRRILQGRRPSFSHHAITLLMANDSLHNNALTTNFDKLLERSFTEQNLRECQAIRMPEEAEFWGPERDKCYVFKLHGDYDTHNILNTRPETRSIPSFYMDLAKTVLVGRGLLVLGSAGNEESIIEFFKRLLQIPERRMLSRGVRWGVYAGPRKPPDITDAESVAAVLQAVENGALNRHLVELLGDMNDKYGDRRPCSVFPLWGSGNFLRRLIAGLGDPELEEKARLLLDHEMRLASLFRKRGLTPVAIETHLAHLSSAQARLLQHAAVPDVAPRVTVQGSLPSVGTIVRVVYGDITGRAIMSEITSTASYAAVVSPEDTMISAGGGVALRLLQKAGSHMLLNELAKLAPIPHGTAVVTSGGDLPVQYIIHAAALDVTNGGEYVVTSDSVQSAIRDALQKADALHVETILVPLLGAGVAGLSTKESLTSILAAISEVPVNGYARTVIIVIYDESNLSHDSVRSVLTSQGILPADSFGATADSLGATPNS